MARPPKRGTRSGRVEVRLGPPWWRLFVVAAEADRRHLGDYAAKTIVDRLRRKKGLADRLRAPAPRAAGADGEKRRQPACDSSAGGR